MTAFEQRDANLVLECLDLSRQRRLGEKELFRRARKAQVARCRIEAFEKFEIGQIGAPTHEQNSCNACEFIV